MSKTIEIFINLDLLSTFGLSERRYLHNQRLKKGDGSCSLNEVNEMENAMKTILRRLLNKRRIGGKHTEEKNVFRFAKNLSREEQKQLEEDYKWCIKAEWIILKKSTGEVHISLNPRKLKEILEAV